jgi:hypothetical protein
MSKYEITRSEKEDMLIKDIEQRLDNSAWYSEGCSREIMFVPIGIIRRDGKIFITIKYDIDLLR